tara:strand:- start:2874 stop:3911 length:1038 start_codon:yes stop_codon:yes gene_type:complete
MDYFSSPKLLFFIFTIIAFTFLNNYSIKLNLLLDNIKIKKHKSLATKISTPLTGGFYLLVTLSFFYFHFDKNFLIFIILIFLTGLISDVNLIDNPKLRIIFQVLVILICLITLDLRIDMIRFSYFDDLLKNNIFNIFFTSFCIVLIVNGFNFIDGLNTLSLGYFINVVLVIFFSSLIYSFDLSSIIPSNYIILHLFFLFLVILFGKSFLGDSGSYLLGLYLSVIIIRLYQFYPEISPWFFALLLWYPAFEVLFSIIRKLKKKMQPFLADDSHLHQKIYLFVDKKFKTIANSLSANIINSYNIIIFFIAVFNIYNSLINILLIFLNIVVYIVFYCYLSSNNGKKNN